VPFAVALTASLAGTPVLAEELGGCTVPPGQATQTWEWPALGRSWSQLMLSEEDLAAYLEAVLPRLVEVGALGALLWCFADYHPDLWASPPCDTKLHERHFGLVRPDGTLKPHAEVLRRFIASDPRVAEPPAWARIEVTGDAFYVDPSAALPALYDTFRRRGMAGSSDALHLVDARDANRYEIVADGEAEPVAIVDYAMRDGGTVLLMHTEVRPELEGRGIGTKTARLVVDHVRDTGLKAIVGCPFLTSWLRRHPEEQDILARPLRDP
jgi:predicted GNAT family acetyltransferase